MCTQKTSYEDTIRSLQDKIIKKRYGNFLRAGCQNITNMEDLVEPSIKYNKLTRSLFTLEIPLKFLGGPYNIEEQYTYFI